MKNTINIKVLCGRDYVAATGKTQVVYSLVEMTPAGGNGPRAPANFCLVLDRSGSMEGAKMDSLKKAVEEALAQMTPKDRVSIVIFDDEVEVLVPSQAMTDPKKIVGKVAGVIPRGGTQIGQALKKGMEEIDKAASPDMVNRILLLTDGETWGDEGECLAIAREAGGKGTAIATAGIGEEWNENLLLGIAERSHGDSHWIRKPEEIASCFLSEMAGMRAVLASSAEAILKLSPGVGLTHAHRTQPMISEMTIPRGEHSHTFSLGEVNALRGQSLLFELQVPSRETGPYRVGQVEVSYQPSSSAGTGRVTEKADIQVEFSTDAALIAKVNPHVMNLVEKIGAFKLQTRALKEAELGNVLAATRKLEAAATRLLDIGEKDLADTAREEAKALTSTGKLTGKGTKKLAYGTRKLTQKIDEEIQEKK